ncbi:hypothetical protein GCM10009795_025180 [Nocardioides hankookensis]|uniref:Uncharacterized protein n=1 Tax=Nocardioides hankookensis TaxID=443157 RepID=A0ABW1LEV1_9ACTN
MSAIEAPVSSRMPPSAYVLAWLCLLGQLPSLATRGLSDGDGVWVLLSMVLGALVIAWFSAGVLRARIVRLVVVWIVLVLGALLVAVDVVQNPHTSWWDLLLLLASIGQVAALGTFCSTDYFRWQRAQPTAAGPDISTLVAIAVVVGLVGGITAPAEHSDSPIQLRIAL